MLKRPSKSDAFPVTKALSDFCKTLTLAWGMGSSVASEYNCPVILRPTSVCAEIESKDNKNRLTKK